MLITVPTRMDFRLTLSLDGDLQCRNRCGINVRPDGFYHRKRWITIVLIIERWIMTLISQITTDNGHLTKPVTVNERTD